MENMQQLQNASRRAGLLTIGGFIIILASLFYSYFQLSGLEEAIQNKKIELVKQQKEIDDLKIKTANYKNETEKLRFEAVEISQKVKELDSTQQSLLDFLVSVTDAKNISILGSDVNWAEVKRQLNGLPAGKRKNAILNAILLAWKDIPFTMGREDVRSGFDSPRFLRYVLKTVGVDVKFESGKPLSVTLMEHFQKVDKPKPGDLVFFKGQVGNFGFILVSVGNSNSGHVGIGTLKQIAPLQIISMGNINTPYFPLRGYYRFVYPDE